ncbi:MAG: hypothetical protein NTV51_26250 [Verrucomicrobia bacterium]|nr:hypothetical protein [Verrucomicrobiota bacterium]
MKRLLPRLLVAAALFIALAALCLRNYYPPLANPLIVDLVLDRGTAGQSEPLVVAGRELFGDFLFARYIDETHVVFGYDSWGHPGQIGTTPVAIVPGAPLRLSIEMPALNQLRGDFSDPPGRIRVTCRDQVVFDVTDHYFMREPRQIHLAENPLGGSACGPRLHGRLLSPDGRELRGDPARFFTLGQRVSGWLTHSRQIFALVLLCGALAAGWFPAAWFQPAALRAVLAAIRIHRWFVGTATVCGLLFAWMVTTGTFHFAYPEDLGSFYDYQATSLLHGRLDVTDDAIGGEAFVFEGKLYGYFGPTSALLRLPFVIFGFGFGTLTRAFMLGYFVAALFGCYVLLRQACRLTGRTQEPPPWAVVLLIGHAGLGSTLFYLSSRAYVYHEAILGGVVFALFTCHFALRHLVEPSRRWWLWALACALLSLHARPPTGLFALTFLGCVHAAHLLAALRRRSFGRLARPVGLGLLCIPAVLTFNGLSYLKFKTFDGAPLRYSRPYGPERLAKIDGKSFHAANVPYGFYTYFVRPNFRLEPKFPWFYIGSPQPGWEFPDKKIDLPDHTLAVSFAMPGLFLLASLGGLATALAFPATRSALLVTWIAVVPMSLALFAAIATAQRYTGDWIPFLACAGAFGLAGLISAPFRLRLAFGALLALATLAAVLLTFALTLHYQRAVVWGIEEEVRQSYQEIRQRIDAAFGQSAPTP